MTVVLDAAALMAMLLDEPGADLVEQVVGGSLMSTVNISECCARAGERNADLAEVLSIIVAQDVAPADFTREHAVLAARLREPTRSAGLSLGDRACLALAQERDATVYTADRRMASFDGKLGIDIRLIR